MPRATGWEGLDAGGLGARLRAARRERGSTQGEVAERLGMARTTLVAIEAGQRRVTAHELIEIAACYGRPISELVGKAEEPAVQPQFRKRAGGSASEREMQEAGEVERELLARVRDYKQLEELVGEASGDRLPPEYRAQGGAGAALGEAAATAERNRLGTGDGPLGSLRQRLEADVGVRVFGFSMASSIAGVVVYTAEMGGCVGINSRHPGARQKWTLAHEYGHLLLTRQRAEVTYLRAGRNDGTERMVDAFARHFLMPGAGLRRRATEMAALSGRGLSAGDALQLAQLYQVSAQAMVLRLEDLGCVSAGAWDRLVEAGFKVGQAQAALGIEPVEDAVPEFPARYQALAARAWERELISEGQLAQFLRTDRVSAREMVERMGTMLGEGSGEMEFTRLPVRLGQSLGGD